MPVTYQIVGCSNPRGAEGVDYACNRTVKTGDYTFEASLLKHIRTNRQLKRVPSELLA